MNWEETIVWLRDQKSKRDLVKDCFYDDPIVSAADRYWKSSEWDAVKKLLPRKKGNVLDIGAGRGITSYAFAKDGWKVTAVEPNPGKIVGIGAIKELSKSSGISITVCNKWGEKLPFEDLSFDVVFVREVLHHAKDLGKFCKEMSRVLKKGGTFIAIREHVVNNEADLKIFLKNHPLHKLYGGENAYKLNVYIDAIEKAGVRLTSILNPLESDINLYPRKNSFIPVIIMSFIGSLINYPGRLYSFIGRKK